MTFVKVNNRPVVKNFDGILNELFGNFENTAGKNVTASVPVNILEATDGYHLEFSVPGRSKELFKLKVEDKLLTISYEAAKAEENTELKQVRKEFNTNAFSRSFTLDEKTNADGILAKYEDGLLKVFVPKKEEVKPTVKEINVG